MFTLVTHDQTTKMTTTTVHTEQELREGEIEKIISQWDDPLGAIKFIMRGDCYTIDLTSQTKYVFGPNEQLCMKRLKDVLEDENPNQTPV